MFSKLASYMDWLSDTMAADVTSMTCPDAPPAPSSVVSAASSVEEDTCSCDHHCSLPHGDWGCCSEECPCQEGEGDCEADEDCQEGLVCGKDNCLIGGHRGDCCQETYPYESPVCECGNVQVKNDYGLSSTKLHSLMFHLHNHIVFRLSHIPGW